MRAWESKKTKKRERTYLFTELYAYPGWLLAVHSIRHSRMRDTAAPWTGLQWALPSHVGGTATSDVIAPYDALALDAAAPREQPSAHSISSADTDQLMG